MTEDCHDDHGTIEWKATKYECACNGWAFSVWIQADTSPKKIEIHGLQNMSFDTYYFTTTIHNEDPLLVATVQVLAFLDEEDNLD